MDIEQIERIVKDALDPCSTQTLRELVELAENAVSYTHLDVYKRQLFAHGAQDTDPLERPVDGFPHGGE